MTYRIRRGDEDLGTATLEELRARRESGVLTGGELVQGGDSPEWVLLESVLKPAEPPPLPPVLAPPLLSPGAPAPKRRLGRLFPLLLAVLVLALSVTAYLIRRVQQEHPAEAGTDTAPRAAPGLAAASKPVQVTATPTVEEVRKRERAFKRRQWLDGYQQRSVHLPRADAANERYIRVFLDHTDDSAEADGPLKLDVDCLRIAQDPDEQDPLILTLAAVHTVNWYRRVELFKRALALYPASQHRAYPAFFADVYLMDDSKEAYDQEGELNTTALKRLALCFTDGSFQPGDQQEIASLFVNEWGKTFFERNDRAVCDIVHQAGPGYQWLALVLDAKRLITDGWAARGGGYISTVSEQGYNVFDRDMNDARDKLTAAWKLHPDFPIAPSLAVYAALNQDIDAMRMWFDRAVASQIDAPAAWSNMRWGLRPRWYGSTAAELAFGKVALNTGRFDTDVPRKFFDCVSDIEQETPHPAGQRLFGRADIWPELQRMYTGYIAAPSQAKHVAGWRASYAIVAYFAHHYDVSAQQLAQIGWQLPAISLTTWGTDLSAMPMEVAARTGPQAAGIAAAEVARASGNRAEALRRFAALAALKTGDERTQEFIRFRLAHLTEEQHLEDGRWISLIPASDHDKDWVYSLGEAHRTPAGDLDVEYGTKGHMLYPKIQIGADFEVRGSFEVVRSTNTNFQGGIVIGLPDFDNDLNGNNWWGFRVKRHDEEGDIVCFGEGWTLREITQRVILNDKVNTFDLVVSEDHVTATVNGERVITNAPVPSYLYIPESSYFVGLGAFSDSADAVVRYHGVEVRRLSLTEDALNAGSAPSADADSNPDTESSPVAMAVAPLHPDLPVADQVAADTLEMNRAVDRVKEIVNRPAPFVAPQDGMKITWWDGSWFHPGADTPDYLTVDISKTRENPYQGYDYVGTNLHPDMVFAGRDLEFNSKTKLYYADRSLPKRKLTRAEMAEINRLYRVIGRCRADLARLQPK